MKALALLPALLLLQIAVFAQKAPMKFGKIEDAEIEMTECAFDSEAHAVVLGEYGNLYFQLRKEKGFQYVYEYHKRIKIFDKEAYGEADIAIPFYEGTAGNKELITSIKASTYNMENGKLEEYKVNNKDEFEEKMNEYWYVKKFSFPNVKEGSIIEYTYTIISDYPHHLRGWQFEGHLPKVFSEYHVITPEFYNYQTIMIGDFGRLAINEESNQQESFEYNYTTEANALARIEKVYQQLNSRSRKYHWKTENQKAFKQEPYMTGEQDYAMSLGFQLLSIQYPGQAVKVVGGSYDAHAKTLMTHPNFGLTLKRDGFLSAVLSKIKGESATDMQKAVNIYEHIKHKTRWDGFEGQYANKSLKETYDKEAGNVADINLLLTAALNKAGFLAHPVILSTRDNGKPHPIYPDNERLNYVLAYVEVDGRGYLLDATANSGLPFGELPERCLNGQGWVVSERGVKVVNLQHGAVDVESIMVQAKLDGENIWKVDVEASYKGQQAYQWRRTDDENKSREAFQKQIVDWTVSELTWEEDNNIYKPLKMKLKLESEPDNLADIIYFNPNIYGLETENPFKNETRQYPIDMPYSQSRRYVMMITLPNGYALDSEQQPMIFHLPNNAGLFKYTINQSGNIVTVINSLKLNKTFFGVEEYAALRQFFETVVAKNNEQLVFKKKEE